MSKAPQTKKPGGTVLTVAEVAARWRVTTAHVSNLIEAGELAALDVSGRRDCFPMPKAAVNQLAARLRVTPEQLLEFIRTIKPNGKEKNRALWRVPVESYTACMEKRNSLNLK